MTLDPDDEATERAAAELAAALADEATPLPAALRDAIVARGEALLAGQAAAPAVTPLATARRRTAPAWLGWVAAAAAVAAWLVVPIPLARQPRAPGAMALRDSLSRAGTPLTIPWTATPDPAAAGASGEVVWSDRLQAGVLRIAGLAPNDPRRVQYQLWIFDRTRDARYPVDGGVFDIAPGGGEALIPVHPAVRVGDATMFAVTVERPGGVVVSNRERIVLVAERRS